MILKKFYGKTIKKAREKAFDQLGEDCIVLETKDVSEKQDACVTVMLDGKKSDALKKNNLQKETSGNNPPGPQTYSRKDLFPKSLDKVKEAVSEGFNKFSSEMGLDNESRPKAASSNAPSAKKTNGNTPLTMSRRSKSVYQSGREKKQTPTDFRQQFSKSMNTGPVSREVKALHRRFDHMEKLLSDALISANLEYVSHPAFQQLLHTGMQPTAVSRWFEQVLNKGIDPYEQGSAFMAELAGIVRSALSVTQAGDPQKHLLFVGPSGSGKTSLIMKLAAQPDFMGDKSIALVSIEPTENAPRYSVLKLFADDHELPFYNVGNEGEANNLLPELEPFDHVFFDTPPVSLQKKSALKDYWDIRQLLSSVEPLEVHYTINATLERYYFNERYAANHPLQPDFVAITHMDETDKWGRLIPLMNGMDASVRYVSRGPNQLQTFQSQWFAEQILSIS